MSRFSRLGETNAVMLYASLSDHCSPDLLPCMGVTIIGAVEAALVDGADLYEVNVTSPEGIESAIRIEFVSALPFYTRTLVGKYRRLSLAVTRKPELDGADLERLFDTFEGSIGADPQDGLVGMIFATGEYMRDAGEGRTRFAVPCLLYAGRILRVLITVEPRASYRAIPGARMDRRWVVLRSESLRLAA